MPVILIPMCAFIQAQSKIKTGIYFVDTTTLMFVTLKEHLQIELLKGGALWWRTGMAVIGYISLQFKNNPLY